MPVGGKKPFVGAWCVLFWSRMTVFASSRSHSRTVTTSLLRRREICVWSVLRFLMVPFWTVIGLRRRKECKCPVLMGRRKEVQVQVSFVNRFAICRDPDRQASWWRRSLSVL